MLDACQHGQQLGLQEVWSESSLDRGLRLQEFGK
jgi:hypothetical protein